MDVFVIPVGTDRYELYCEPLADADGAEAASASGMFGWLRYRFSVMLRTAEERQLRRREPATGSSSWPMKFQHQVLVWVSQRIAEQRLLWNLRRETSAVAVHPEDMTFDQVLTLIHRRLQRDYERHRVWLGVDALGLIVSIPVTLIPGPNLVQYYFVFRVVGHWLSMRGAAQGRHCISWSGRPCPHLAELREVVALEAAAREARVHDIADRLRLPHLKTFFERVAVRHA